MRFMIMVRANALSEAGEPPADMEIFAEMARYHDELAKAGVLLDASGLQPSSRGFRVHYTNGKPTIVDGPFAETKELIAGYTLIQVRSRDEAIEWARRFPAPFGKHDECEIEVRQLYELEELPECAGVERFRELQAQRKAS
ncbi:YciI family protein [Paraburkholderia sp. JHI2823]|uniref:YciI family protein n=1 Tax=Paraburkholderia TaxID=1822464 RepID=UPI003173D6E5